MRVIVVLFAFLLVFAVLPVSADLQFYTGSLSVADGGIIASGPWGTDTGDPDWFGATIEWIVQENGNGSWNYSYFIDVPEHEVSHVIIEVSDTFTFEDLDNPTGPYTELELDDFQTTGTGGSNPYMPEDIYGLKFDSTYGTHLEISFDSWRIPVWGDFYLKDGKVDGEPIYAYNSGFTINDIDPLTRAHSGAEDGHLLVPDSRVPEPATTGLLIAGLVSLGAAMRRRRNQGGE